MLKKSVLSPISKTSVRNLLLLWVAFSISTFGCGVQNAAPETSEVVFLSNAESSLQGKSGRLDHFPASSPLEVHYIDVGTGDCIWIKTGDDGIPGNGRLEGLNIIIDGGDAPSFGRVDGYKAASQYLTENDKLPKGETIDWMILS